MFTSEYLIMLRKLVLFNMGIKKIAAADCKFVAATVSKKVNKSLSETTLKRFFGFAHSGNKFSEFTLNALCEYIGIENWEKFCEINNSLFQPSESDWNDLQRKINNISSFTLETIRSQSGIPYKMTTPRSFANDEILAFLKSDKNFTCFYAPRKFGKSTLLAHVIENFIYRNNRTSCLFLNTNMLSHKPGNILDFEVLISELLSLPAGCSFIDYFEKYRVCSSQQLVVVIDGLDRDSLSEMPKYIFDSLVNFICRNSQKPWLKFIFSIRSFCWQEFHERIKNSAELTKAWFKGNNSTREIWRNIPLLNELELGRILKPITSVSLCKISPRLVGLLKYPNNVHLFNNLKLEKNFFDETKEISSFQLIAKFVKETLRFSKNYTEKIVLIKYFLKLTNYGQSGNCVCKSDMLNLINQYSSAYEELLIDGILLQEYESQGKLLSMERISFLNQDLFYYFLFLEIYNFNEQPDEETFFVQLQKNYADTLLKTALLELWAWHSIRKERCLGLHSLLTLKFTNQEKIQSIIVAIETLETLSPAKKQSVVFELEKHKLHSMFIPELARLDFTNPKLLRTVSALLRFSNDEKYVATYNFFLAAVQLYSVDSNLDKKFILKYIERHHATPINEQKLA